MLPSPRPADRANAGAARPATAAPTDRARRARHAAGLMARCAAGDHQALAELHALYSAAIGRFARGIVRSHEAAEEVVQEVFL